jgi:hypothetical protein
MKFLDKNKNEEHHSTPQSSSCQHKFQDFPWYIESNMVTGNYQSQNRLTYRIIEPYVCIYCGERRDIVLEQRKITGYSKSDMTKIIDNIREIYSDRIKPKPIIEDMINDLKLVDVEHLKWYHFLAGTEDPSTSRPKQTYRPQLKF